MSDQSKNVEFTLSAPIKIDSNEVSALTFHLRKMNLNDMRIMDTAKGDVDLSIKVISLLTNIPEEAAEQISIDDLDGINEVISPFFKSSQEIGRR